MPKLNHSIIIVLFDFLSDISLIITHETMNAIILITKCTIISLPEATYLQIAFAFLISW